MKRLLEHALRHWKEQADRLPLLIRGARQVGKTHLISHFASTHFTHSVTINFEQQRQYLTCFKTLEPQKILDAIFLLSKQKIIPGKTLLFLDEIQDCPQAILALRYFYEQMPSLHVIAAGSLLEFALNAKGFRMPVGRIQSLYLYPLSFKEFLMASGEAQLVDYIGSISLDDEILMPVHEHLLSLLKEYWILGGMPAVLNRAIGQQDIKQAQMMQSALLDGYRSDFGKYANQRNMAYLQNLFDKTPGLVAQHFKYVTVDPEAQSRDIRVALNDLIYAGLITKVHATTASGLPFSCSKNEKKFKLLFIDVGLVSHSSSITSPVLSQDHSLLMNHGDLAEQFVGQELLSYGPSYRRKALYYWERPGRTSSAEVDYVIACDSTIIPIEVKAGARGKLRSMRIFLDEKKLSLGIQISQNTLSFDKNIISLPLYMVSEIPRLVRQMK